MREIKYKIINADYVYEIISSNKRPTTEVMQEESRFSVC